MFQQTRGDIQPREIDFQEAILSPSADFGGLYTLDSLPNFNNENLIELSKLSYIELSKRIFAALKLGLDEEILNQALLSYAHFDDPHEPACLVKLHDRLYVQELYHGPTRAFKDMALQPFGAILSALAQKRQEKYLILAATSGDTGPATLHALANKSNIQVVCLYPSDGTSDIQRLQMTTADAKNLKVIGIKGNFDDAQRILKQLLNDQAFKKSLSEKNILLSAANSVNFGRIVFQMLYHAYASLKFDGVDVIVPSGNFGNALGAFYAKKMGFKIGKIIIASNSNNILTEWITSGVYDLRHRSLHKTPSPAMDILRSSNVERVLFALFGAQRTRELLESLDTQGVYALSASELAVLQSYFDAMDCSDEESLQCIAHYANQGYLIDPHTAVGMKVYEKVYEKACKSEKQKEAIKILCSTAEWTKFAPTIALALNQHTSSDKEALELIAHRFHIPIHANITELFNKAERHTQVIEQACVAQEILKWL